MAKKTEKRGANKTRTEEKKEQLQVSILSMQFWRKLAKEVCPNITDDNELGEVALILQELSQLVGTEFERISQICDDNLDTQIKIGLQVEIDRRTQPSEVSSGISYAKKYRAKMKAQVPDPNQDELPGLTEAKGTSETGDEPELGEKQ